MVHISAIQWYKILSKMLTARFLLLAAGQCICPSSTMAPLSKQSALFMGIIFLVSVSFVLFDLFLEEESQECEEENDASVA
jgi:hypothetical protein